MSGRNALNSHQQTWWLSYRNSPSGRALADRHYNRQSVGASGFVPPGRCLVLRQEHALWVTSWPLAEYVQHEWAGAWINSTFRREGGDVASELILQAVAATLAYFGEPPDLGMVTFIDAEKVRHKRDPGRCYLRAGFKRVGVTKDRNLIALQLLPADMPDALPALGSTLELAI